MRELEKRIEKVKKALLAIDDMHPGSLSKQYNICGQPGCCCKDSENPKKHGPYYNLSYALRGRSTSRFIRPEFVAEVKQQIKNYKKFKELVDEWKNLAAERAKLRTDIAIKKKLSG